MSRYRPIVRRLFPYQVSHVEQHLWPVQAALMVFAAFALGVTQAWTSWREPHLLRNTACWWGFIAIALTAALWGVSRLPTRRVRRVSILAAVLSLTAHLAFLVISASVGLFGPIRAPETSLVQDRRQPSHKPLPEYSIQVYHEPNSTADDARPVAAETAEPMETAAERAEESLAFVAPVLEASSEPSAALAFADEPPQRRDAPAPVREAPQPGRLARATASNVNAPRPVPTPPRPHPPASSIAQGERRRAATREFEPTPDALPTRLARDQDAASPQNDMIMSPSTPTITLAPQDQLPVRVTREQEGEALATFPDQSLHRAPRVPFPAVQPAELQEPSSAPTTSEVAEVVMEPRETKLSSASSLADLAFAESTLSQDFKMGPLDMRSQMPPRVEPAAVATADPYASPALHPRRVLRVAPNEQSPREVPSLSLTPERIASEEITPEAARTVLDQSRDGTAGMGESSNLAEAAHRPQGAAAIPSDFADRREPTQFAPRDRSMSPLAAARIPRTQGAQPRPLAARPIQSVEAPAAPHDPQLSPEVAMSSASLAQAEAQAPHAETTGDVGEGRIDLGPPRWIREGVERRAGGGGAPRLHPSANPLARARATIGGAPRASLAAPQVAASAASMLGQGSGAIEMSSADAIVQPQTAQLGADFVTEAPPSSFRATEEATSATSRGSQTGPTRRGGGSGPEAGPLELANNPRPLSRAARRSGPWTAPRSAAEAVESGSPRSSGSDIEMSLGDPGERELDTSLGREDGAARIAGAGREGDQRQGAGEISDEFASPTATDRSANATEDWRLDAAEGIPGLARGTEATPGMPDARGERDGTAIGMLPRRFRQAPRTMLPSTAHQVAVAADAFRHRRERTLAPRGDSAPSIAGGPTTRTEAAIELGLAYLSRMRELDGRWSLQKSQSAVGGQAGPRDPQPSLRSDTAATGLGLLAFLGAGYHHQDDPYRDQVRGGLAYLIAHQADDGNLYVSEDEISNQSVALYSHGIASLALSEAYGMTQDPWLREPAQKALDYIAAAQHPRLGGWRYAPGVNADTSVSGWMMMALKSGELAGLTISPDAYAGIDQWLDGAQVDGSNPHLYRYNPYAPDTRQQRHGRQATPTMTSVGLLMRLYGGWRREDAALKAGADYLLENPPTDQAYGDTARNTYYWYYATQVMFHMGGDHWRRWNEQLHPLLVDSQIAEGDLAGSWHPRNPVPDRWGPQGGRIYVTTMNLLSLEIHYRHLPLYDEALAAP